MRTNPNPSESDQSGKGVGPRRAWVVRLVVACAVVIGAVAIVRHYRKETRVAPPRREVPAPPVSRTEKPPVAAPRAERVNSERVDQQRVKELRRPQVAVP